MALQDKIQTVSTKIASDTMAQSLVKTQVNSSLNSKVAQIRNKVRELQRNLSELDEKLARDGISADLYSTGVDQGKGAEIDKLIAELVAVREVVTFLGDAAAF